MATSHCRMGDCSILWWYRRVTEGFRKATQRSSRHSQAWALPGKLPARSRKTGKQQVATILTTTTILKTVACRTLARGVADVASSCGSFRHTLQNTVCFGMSKAVNLTALTGGRLPLPFDDFTSGVFVTASSTVSEQSKPRTDIQWLWTRLQPSRTGFARLLTALTKPRSVKMDKINERGGNITIIYLQRYQNSHYTQRVVG
jgi:hypothetical protein